MNGSSTIPPSLSFESSSIFGSPNVMSITALQRTSWVGKFRYQSSFFWSVHCLYQTTTITHSSLFAQIWQLLSYKFFITLLSSISSPVNVDVIYSSDINFEFEILISKQYSVEAGNHGSVSLVLDSWNRYVQIKALFSEIKSDKSISKNVLSIPRYEYTGGSEQVVTIIT
jgi:hypothetical protein